MTLICKRCNKSFESTHSRRQYCSRICSNRNANDMTKVKFMEKSKVIVWSCGGGIDSTAIAILIIQGKLPRPDFAIMVDVGYEPQSTWNHVNNILKPRLRTVGVELHILRSNEWIDTSLVDHRGWCCLPAYCKKDDIVQKLSTRCSGNWKVKVAKKWLRKQGVEKCEQWIGMAVDEQRRAKPDVNKWIHLRWPLIEFKMTREDCIWLIGGAGWPPAPRTSCYLCPQQADKQWLRLMNEAPKDFEKACIAEQSIQLQCPDVFLHRFCVPLNKAIERLQQKAFTYEQQMEGVGG